MKQSIGMLKSIKVCVCVIEREGEIECVCLCVRESVCEINTKLRTPDPRPKTPDPRPQTSDPRPQTPDPEAQTLRPCRTPYALTPSTVEPILTLGALLPPGGPIQDPDHT